MGSMPNFNTNAQQVSQCPCPSTGLMQTQQANPAFAQASQGLPATGMDSFTSSMFPGASLSDGSGGQNLLAGVSSSTLMLMTQINMMLANVMMIANQAMMSLLQSGSSGSTNLSGLGEVSGTSSLPGSSGSSSTGSSSAVGLSNPTGERIEATGNTNPQMIDALNDGMNWIGLHEDNDAAKLEELAGYDMGSMWCAKFVSALLERNGGSPWGREGWVMGIKDWGVKNDKYIDKNSTDPQVGDIFIQWRDSPGSGKGHIGIIKELIRDDSGKVVGFKSLEGNVSDSVAIREHKISEERLMGYVRL